MKKTLILMTILALSTTTVFAGNTTTKTTDKQAPAQFEKPNPMGPPPEFRGKDFRKAEFEKRLNLTEKQKTQINKNREADRKQIQPIMEKIRQKEMAKREIIKKYESTDPDLIKLNKEINNLRAQKHKIMEKNRKSFESLLTTQQKAELQKMKEERLKMAHPKGARPHRPDFN